jgi:hypothetical protein
MRSTIFRTLALATLLLAGGAAFASDIHVEFQLPSGMNPTFVTDKDGSGSYRIVRMTETAWKLVNFDPNIDLVITNVRDVVTPSLVVSYGGTNGPDPMPTVRITVTHTGCGPENPEKPQELPPGERLTVAAHDVTITPWR